MRVLLWALKYQLLVYSVPSEGKDALTEQDPPRLCALLTGSFGTQAGLYAGRWM
jgi:hypothetical protein